MESVHLYLFKTERINFVNLLQFCFYLARRDLYQPCLPIFTGSHLDITKGELVNTFSPDDPDNFRNISWNEKLQLLNSTLESTDQKIVIGNYNIDQIMFLKQQYPSMAQTISCSYTEEDYDLLLTYIVNQHVELQASGMLPITEHDQHLRADSSISLLSYYKKSFDEQQLIPKSITYSTDYVVPLKDFFNKDNFFQHLTNLGADPTPEATHYYDQWWALQQPYFNGTQL